jgi:hypothetical protein
MRTGKILNDYQIEPVTIAATAICSFASGTIVTFFVLEARPAGARKLNATIIEN